MKIECLTTFLDGRERFEKDDIRTVDDARGQSFVDNGWAKNLDTGEVGTPVNGDAKLAIDNVNTKTGDIHG